MDADSVAQVGPVAHGSEPESDGIDFSANVNPETPDGVERVYRNALTAAHSYPPRGVPRYRQAAAAYVDVDPSAVVPTPGGLAAIRLALSTTVDPGDRVLVPFPSFGEYVREVRLQGAEPVFVPVDELLDADPTEAALTIVCNPNNPTGQAFDADALRSFVDRSWAAGTPVLVDEAFLGFTEEPTLAGTPGTIVARSLTKLFGLPGLRAGFAVATGELEDRLEAARLTWNLGVPAAETGAHVMRDEQFVEQTRQRVRRERSQLRRTLGERYQVHDSAAPFLLLTVEDPVTPLLERARERGVILRDARSFRGLDAHVRVTVRRPSENRRLEEVLLDV
jgi:histidinol-phosphate/aromatic aminotransferase/cobyric acid decarboxylase-like protein